MRGAQRTDPTTWSLDREIVIARVSEAPREAVFRAWTDPDRIGRWFGPNGFTCRIHSMDFRVGGRWPAERRKDVIGWGAVKLGFQTLDKLAAEVRAG